MLTNRSYKRAAFAHTKSVAWLSISMMQGRLCSNSGRLAVGMSNNNDHESIQLTYIAALMDIESCTYRIV